VVFIKYWTIIACLNQAINTVRLRMSFSDEVPIRLADLYPVQLFIRFNLKILSIEFIWDLEKCSMIYIKTGLPKYKMKLTYMKYI
jgi:hypothetical protein